jgi:hypothetical protein
MTGDARELSWRSIWQLASRDGLREQAAAAAAGGRIDEEDFSSHPDPGSAALSQTPLVHLRVDSLHGTHPDLNAHIESVIGEQRSSPRRVREHWRRSHALVTSPDQLRGRPCSMRVR